MRKRGGFYSILSCFLLALLGVGFVASRWWPIHAALSQLRAHEKSENFDLHGNASEEAQTLMLARFRATHRICQELDATATRGFPNYRQALYDVLGFVKDPESIPWLEAMLGSSDEVFVYEHWLPRWKDGSLGAVTHSAAKWLEGGDSWAAFFRRWAERADASSHRLQILGVLTKWFHDPSSVEYFERLEKKPDTKGEELLLIQLYLHLHDRPYDRPKLEKVIVELGRRPDSEGMLLRYAQALRSEAFVPWLVARAHSSEAQRALECITLVRGVFEKADWEAWQAREGVKGRDIWMKQAVDSFDALLATDEAKAHAFLDKAVYTWNDIALLPHVQRWMVHPALAGNLIGWINLTYQPAYRERLRLIAAKILLSGSGPLEDWARDLLKGLNFVEDPEDTWQRHVQYSNSHV